MKELAATSIEAWEALCVQQFQSCQVDRADRGFTGHLRSSTRLPTISLAKLTSGAFGVSRTIAHTRRNETDDLMLVMHHTGQPGAVEHNGTRTLLQPGGAVLIDTSRPYRFEFPGTVEQTVVKLPRAATGLAAKTAGTPVDLGGSASLRVLNSILRELEQIDSTATEHLAGAGFPGAGGPAVPARRLHESEALVNAAVEMAGAAFASVTHGGSSAGHEALLRCAQEYVRLRLWDPRLGPDMIAAHLGSSVRFVSSLFAEQGTSPAAFIRESRLEKASRLLTANERQHTAIFDIALRVGFLDATTFARAFKRRYGMVPSDYRKAGAAG
jgi:AraC-like DNA-binding protein